MRKNKILYGILSSFALLTLGLGLAGRVEAKAVEGVVNINTASAKELMMLPGVGKAKAEQIIQLRQAKPFTSVEDLKSIKGLGAKRIEAMRTHVTVSGATTAKAVKAPAKSAKTPATTTSSTSSPSHPKS
jgi:competence protein ComEA